MISGFERGMNMIRQTLVALALTIAATNAQAQTAAMPSAPLTAEEKAEMDQLRAEIATGKKAVVQENVGLTEAEGAKFWPIYDRYQGQLQGFNKRLLDGIDRYATAYNANTITDAQAKTLGNDLLKLEADELKAKQKMFAEVSKVLPGKKAARYLQIENKIRALLRFEMAADIPLVK